MAYNIRGKTLSTVIPQSLYTKYPNFVTFLDKYYEWARKSSLEMSSYQGNLNLSSKSVLIVFMIIGRVELLTILIICKKFLFKN